MRVRSRYFPAAITAILFFAVCAIAQTGTSGPTPPPPVDAVRPGTVNYVEGQVSLNGEPLNPGQHAIMQIGQTLNTAANGYAEVLLTPGAFLRVGPNSEFRLTAAGLADTRIELRNGSALIEADQFLDGTHVEVTIGRTSVDLLKKGLYAFSTNPAAVRTFDGQVNVVGQAKSRKVGKHKEILLANNDQLKETNFDQDQAKRDPLYVWSEARSRDEAAQNKLVAQNANGYVPVGGGWFWDPYVNYYGFWGPDFFYSPFGFGFYGGFYPGFYGGYWGRYHPGWHGWRGRPGGYHEFHGVHGNGVPGGGFHGGGFHGGGSHGGGGHR